MTGWWFYLQPKIDEYIRVAAGGLPPGGIVAFLSSESEPCPGNKWKIYGDAKGRFIVGAGKGDGLSLREIGKSGGEEKHILTVPEIPSHRHGVTLSDEFSQKLVDASRFDSGSGNSPMVRDGGTRHPYANAISLQTTDTGGNQPHNNMPPYIALYYCKKG